MDLANDLHVDPYATTSLGGSLTGAEEVNSLQKQEQGKGVEHKDKGPEFSLDDFSLKTDATIKDPLPESPASPDLSSSQRIVEFNLNKKNEKRKRLETEHNDVESNVNGCGTPEDAFSSKTSTLALDMPSEHPIQCLSTDFVLRQSCVEADICQGENEEKEQNVLKKAAEKSYGEFDVQEVGCNCNSVVANAEFLAKESVLEVVKMNLEQSINDNSSNPEEKGGSMKKASLVKKHDDYLAVDDFSDECQCVKTYVRRKIFNLNGGYPSPENCHKEPSMQDHHKDDSHKFYDGPLTDAAKESVLEVVKINMEQSMNDNSSNPEENSDSMKNASLVKKHDDYLAFDDLSDKCQCVKTYKRRKIFNLNRDYPSPENCNKEPTLQDHHKDDSHKFSNGPLTDGLMERETKLSRDQVTSHSRVAAEEMELMTENTSEQRFMNTSSVVDIPVMQLEETNARQLDHVEVTRNDLCCPGDVSDLSLVTVNDGNSKISQFSLDRTIISNSKNKLLILDVNGLLADCVSYVPGRYPPEPDFWLKRRKVYKRPFCDDFLQFCFDRFHVGVWSSRAKSNVDEVIKFLMGKSASKLLFCWNQSHCTTTSFSTVENLSKPLVLKELRKLWEKVEPGLPWEKGEFNESNTLLLDDSPYKALMNPMHTAIFPYSYRYYDTKDSSLGPGGDLRVYLEGLAMAENVQEYVSSNPFGQRPIRETNASWGYYRKVIEAVKSGQNDRPSSPARERIAYRRVRDESYRDDSRSY